MPMGSYRCRLEYSIFFSHYRLMEMDLATVNRDEIWRPILMGCTERVADACVRLAQERAGAYYPGPVLEEGEYISRVLW
jgi:hypothetical protein